MTADVYRKLATVLDTLPNGFPATESGVEIRLLRKIFRPRDAEVFCDLRLQFETAAQIAERTGRPLDELEPHLSEMWRRGQVFGVDLGGVRLFKMIPWVFGIYEFQLPHMDRELAELCEAYAPVYGDQFFRNTPQLMQVVPVEKEIEATHEALPYERVSSVLENGKSFLVQDCICKKEQNLLDNPCDRPTEVCLAVAPLEGFFDDREDGRRLSRREAYELLDRCEEQALVHLTWNVQSGHFFVCNCCGCCCGVLRAINERGINEAVNSYYLAEIDPRQCSACGRCAEERCQVAAIEEDDGVYRVLAHKCIGCGLCVSTCPEEAVRLVHKAPEEIVTPPRDETEWFEKRGSRRGVDFSAYK